MTSDNKTAINCFSFLSPVGWLTIFEENNVITAVKWGKKKNKGETNLLMRAQKQILEYFNGNRQTYTLRLRPRGTAFQISLWQQISRIPYGETTTYGNLAINLKTTPRAVGSACGKNPIPIFIPCHRVVGAKNKLIGYSGGSGIETKKSLLSLELKVKNIIK
jgi:methylated-DNA-[protein]-cysteine S-methyltransferase